MMVKTVLIIVSSIMVMEFLVDCLKALADTTPREELKHYERCLNCNAGFCMEDPGSEECRKWRVER